MSTIWQQALADTTVLGDGRPYEVLETYKGKDLEYKGV